eukprot:TRINITY_DN1988_c0_g1_i1.p1 TRINITY_DN1988_c0_g1~~TRINITY_DN1988_c0_g1_i1.p1  ORF type:complete len:154 (-),score=54.61 TRINITY_DN1988_c0_g1_i1:219-680(-)
MCIRDRVSTQSTWGIIIKARPAMSIVLRARKCFLNKCLNRRQMVLDVFHPGLANVSKEKLREMIAKRFRTDEKNITLFGFRTNFGGGKSTGFCFIYENQDFLLKYEAKHRLRRLKLIPAKVAVSRKTRKELKTKRRKVRGKAKSKVQAGQKKK